MLWRILADPGRSAGLLLRCKGKWLKFQGSRSAERSGRCSQLGSAAPRATRWPRRAPVGGESSSCDSAGGWDAGSEARPLPWGPVLVDLDSGVRVAGGQWQCGDVGWGDLAALPPSRVGRQSWGFGAAWGTPGPRSAKQSGSRVRPVMGTGVLRRLRGRRAAQHTPTSGLARVQPASRRVPSGTPWAQGTARP